MTSKGTPTHNVDFVKRLAASATTFGMSKGALDDALGWGLDSDDVREILERLDQFEFLKTEKTRKHPPDTWSDYYSGFVDECMTRMFIKFVIYKDCLLVTSFKEDDSYV